MCGIQRHLVLESRFEFAAAILSAPAIISKIDPYKPWIQYKWPNTLTISVTTDCNNTILRELIAVSHPDQDLIFIFDISSLNKLDETNVRQN